MRNKTKNQTANKVITTEAGIIVPNWYKADTVAAYNERAEAVRALAEAQENWMAQGRPQTEAHQNESDRLRAAVVAASEKASALYKRDYSARFLAASN